MFWSAVVAGNGDVTSVNGDALAGCFCPSVSESDVIFPLQKIFEISKVVITCTVVLAILSLSLGHQMCCTLVTKSLVCCQQLGLESQTEGRHESHSRMSGKEHGNNGWTYALRTRWFERFIQDWVIKIFRSSWWLWLTQMQEIIRSF